MKSVKGRIFFDKNASGIYDIGEDGLKGISIYLSPKMQTVKSDENGNFFFESLFPGDYEIFIDLNQLPVEYKLFFAEKLKIKLTGGQTIFDASFPLILKE